MSQASLLATFVPSATLVAEMKVLVVEDEQDLRNGLTQSLREEGYAVDAAADGEEGLHFALEYDYDAILLDAMLPGIDGWEILERLRARKSTPVLMLTACRTLDDRIHGLDLGADDYLTKPFDLPEVHARLRSIIRRAYGRSSSRLDLGSLQLDTAIKQAYHHSVPVTLTAREYALLEYLALRQGEVVSRSELYEHLFAEEDESFSNLLDVHTCNIRKKLGKDIILTRRGLGYLLP